MSDIDPVEFGRLTAEVESLRNRVGELSADVKQLLELANKSRGGFWVGMAIASSVSSAVTWVASHSNLFK